ncbi:D-glucuronyl C5-epimerase-like isoform X2 [Limulus polyphemus]|uniref:heparosan-N-sulfate-glucuronate 5-epimerase n=1 Tax=Limulus polyphemus TaxID=6850 RepID=A0ABM1T738_LIMPO|nr:D-glucuronyl C5-epimerase-like isoform X2 [Limulus polyphemus]
MRMRCSKSLISPMRMRINLKFLLVILIVLGTITTLTYWIRCGDVTSAPFDHLDRSNPKAGMKGNLYSLDSEDDNFSENDASPLVQEGVPLIRTRGGLKTLDDIDCLINEEYTVSCKQEDGEVFIPFTFLHEYFEVYGKVVQHNDEKHFEWQHSYSKVYHPRGKYDPHGVFMWFENYNVGVRDRVLCISGAEGVPVSTQWDPQGHLYPIQIAQFGLSHFSKNLTEKTPSIKLLDAGEIFPSAQWTMLTNGQTKSPLKRVLEKTTQKKVLEFKTDGSDTDSGLTITSKEDSNHMILTFDLMMKANVTLSVTILGGKRTIYKLHYVMTDSLLSAHENEIFFGIGTSKDWMKITRDLIVDLQKGLMLVKTSRKGTKPRSPRVRDITLRGWGYIDNITLCSSAHMAHFFAVANWFVRHQDEDGGWPIMVSRRLFPGMADLAPGWYSAMGQGQAISVLTRAFKVTGNITYLYTAMKAVKPFKVRSESHGVMTAFAGKYVWYEEYPTIPSSYVLNGFIYSLMGLYDLKMTCTHKDCKEVTKLYEDGMISLKKLLPLFDTGSGSLYDLRHYSLGVAPNLARWDYHTTHINQLLLLSTFESDPILKSVADRWIGYMKGKRAAHN